MVKQTDLGAIQHQNRSDGTTAMCQCVQVTMLNSTLTNQCEMLINLIVHPYLAVISVSFKGSEGWSNAP